VAEVEVCTERVADVPLLVHQQWRMGIPTLLGDAIEPQGNRKGLSIGWLTCRWLSFILREADHRMIEVEPWAVRQIDMPSLLSPSPICREDLTDDRLADFLHVLLGQDQVCKEL
jgi:hypothetical protein